MSALKPKKRKHAEIFDAKAENNLPQAEKRVPEWVKLEEPSGSSCSTLTKLTDAPLATRKTKKNLLRKGIAYTPSDSKEIKLPTSENKATSKVDSDVQGIRLLWDPTLLTKEVLKDVYPEIAELHLCPTLTGGYLKFTENKFAWRAFEKEEQTISGVLVRVEPCSKEWQAKGFQAFLVASVIKLLTAVCKENVPGIVALKNFCMKAVTVLCDTAAHKTITDNNGLDVLGTSLQIASDHARPVIVKHKIIIKCNAPELTFRAIKRAFPKVTGVKFSPTGTCAIATFSTPDDAQAAIARRTDTVHGVPLVWKKSRTPLPTEVFLLISIHKVLHEILKQSVRGEFKLKELPNDGGWRLSFANEEHYNKALAKKRVDVKEYGLSLLLQPLQ